jgi:hypothetical protein
MTSIRAYVRVARKLRWKDSPFMVEASTTPNPRPLTQGTGRTVVQLHTLHFALELRLPEEILDPAKWPTVTVEVQTAEQIPIEVHWPTQEEVSRDA